MSNRFCNRFDWRSLTAATVCINPYNIVLGGQLLSYIKLSSREGCEALAYESVYATAMLRSGIICCVLRKLSSRTKIVGFVHNNG